uniref:Uncharacterized protein n=1 Tax=Pipistrellus kuhlii TaxID=59472 RepID=A0A7J7ZJA1_PIPKU|nr:hypothetical protein mPipKuh1_009464 [Pipistrellus kuhlii]
MGCLSGRGTERGRLKVAPRMGTGAWDGRPQELKTPSFPSYLSQSQILQTGAVRTLRPRASPRGARRVSGGYRESPGQVSRPGGEAAPPALPVEVRVGGKMGGGVPYTCKPKEPPGPSVSPPPPRRQHWEGVLRSGQEGEE